MTPRLRPFRLPALLVLLGTASPAWAVQEGGSPLEWSHPWSLSRLGAALFFMLVSLLVAFGVYFRIRLSPEADVKSAPWPRNVFAESVMLWIALSALVFLAFFAWLEDDLLRLPFRFAPSNMAFVNKHGWELVVCLTAAALCLVAWLVLHHREGSPSKGR